MAISPGCCGMALGGAAASSATAATDVQAQWNQPGHRSMTPGHFSLALPRSSTIGPVRPVSSVRSAKRAVYSWPVCGNRSGHVPDRSGGVARMPLILAVLATRYVVLGARMYWKHLHQFLIASVAVFVVAGAANWLERD
ncbi:MAG: hypothetical protein R2839_12950 [Thermomicrobiales bacterium]